MRGWKLFNLILVVALFAFSAWAYPQLPDRIPTHFGIGGEPDAWSDRSVAAWFLLPAVAAFVTVVMLLVGAMVSRRPQYVNMPAKARLLELPPEEQRPILARVQLFIYRLNALMLVMLSAIQLGSWRAAQSLPSRGVFLVVMLLALGGLPLLTISMVIRTSSDTKEAHRRAKMRGTLRTS